MMLNRGELQRIPVSSGCISHTMTRDEEDYVRDVLRFFYPNQSPTRITTKLGDLAAEMLWLAVQWSKVMNLVPRPGGLKPGLVWLLLQAVKTFWRTQGTQRIYKSVRDTLAGTYRAAFVAACAEAEG